VRYVVVVLVAVLFARTQVKSNAENRVGSVVFPRKGQRRRAKQVSNDSTEADENRCYEALWTLSHCVCSNSRHSRWMWSMVEETFLERSQMMMLLPRRWNVPGSSVRNVHSFELGERITVRTCTYVN